jgi:hypothetical protein
MCDQIDRPWSDSFPSASAISNVRQKSNPIVPQCATIADVIVKVLNEGGRSGLNAEIPEPVWLVLVDCSTAYEPKRFDEKAQRSK